MTVQPEKIKRAIWLKNGNVFDVNTAIELGVAAEAAGWDGVFVSDTFAPTDLYSDPWTVLSAIAVQTEKITLGTWLTPVPAQEPHRLARVSATLDQISHGRLLLGVGLGVPDAYEAFGGTYKPRALGRKYDEALSVITQLWTGEPVTFSGEFFNINEGRLSVVPLQQPRIPIVMGAWWPHQKPFQRAAQWDGIMPAWPAMNPDYPGPQGEKPTNTLEEELRALLHYYKGLRDSPGEIILPNLPVKNYIELCREVEATWLLEMQIQGMEDVQRGPQW